MTALNKAAFILGVAFAVLPLLLAVWSMVLFESGEHTQAAYWIGTACYFAIVNKAIATKAVSK